MKAARATVTTAGGTGHDSTLSDFGRRVVLERARLAAEDPEGEREAVFPMRPERAAYILQHPEAPLATTGHRTAADLLSGDPPEPLVPPFLTPEGATILYAKGGTGKGLVALAARARPRLGRRLRRRQAPRTGRRWYVPRGPSAGPRVRRGVGPAVRVGCRSPRVGADGGRVRERCGRDNRARGLANARTAIHPGRGSGLRPDRPGGRVSVVALPRAGPAAGS